MQYLTPLGSFASLADAARAHKIAGETARTRFLLKKYPNWQRTWQGQFIPKLDKKGPDPALAIVPNIGKNPTHKGGPQTNPLSLARRKFSRHRALAKFRNIGFNFTFDQWYDWWLTNGVDKNVDTKWTRTNRLCMCRINDTGPYEPSNVYCATHVENVVDAFQNNRHVGKGKQQYRWGTELMTKHELLVKYGIDGETAHLYFRDPIYDQARKIEQKKIRAKLLRDWGIDSKRTYFEGKDAWYKTRLEAAQSFGIHKDTYNDRLRRGVYQKRVSGPTLNDYIKKYSRYPDPLFVDEEEDSQ